jgi:carbamoyl-phosphate synthase large subunit
LVELVFKLIASGGNASHVEAEVLLVRHVQSVAQGRPHIIDRIVDGDVQLVFNTTEGWQSLKDSQAIREAVLKGKIPYFTTAAASLATARAIEAMRGHALEVRSLQSYYSASER